MALILKRKAQERVLIGKDIWVQVIEIGQGWVRLGFDAPARVIVKREELLTRPEVAHATTLDEGRGQIAKADGPRPHDVPGDGYTPPG